MANMIDALLNNNPDLGASQGSSPDLSAAIPGITPATENPEEGWHRRHSGVQGVARDILGGLGDFLLSRLHMGTPYSNSKKQHELNYAAEGIDSSDPAQALAAINRVQHVDFTQGTKLRDQFIDNQRQAAARESTAEARAARLALADQARKDKNRVIAASMLNSLVNSPERERAGLYTQQRKQLLTSYPELAPELPENYDSNRLDMFIGSTIPSGVQRAQRLTAEHNVRTEDQTDARINTTIRGQDLNHQDRQAGIAAANARASANRNAANARTANKPAPAPRLPRPTGDDIAYLRKNPGARDKFDGRFGVGLSKRILGN